MSRDLERMVRKQRAEKEAQDKKMAEFEKSGSNSDNTNVSQNVRIEKRRIQEKDKILRDLKK